MKTLIKFVLILLLLAGLVACAIYMGRSEVSDITGELKGVWSYEVMQSDGPCFKSYCFESENVYTVFLEYENNPDMNKTATGTYEVKDSEIILKNEKGEVETIIQFTFENQKLHLTNIGKDRSVSINLKKVD